MSRIGNVARSKCGGKDLCGPDKVKFYKNYWNFETVKFFLLCKNVPKVFACFRHCA